MIFSHTAEYAVRAVTYLAQQPPGTLVGSREVSEAAGVPMPFLSKVLQRLARQRLVRSFKGLRGGYELARPAEEITLHMLLAATGGNSQSDRCVLGLAACSEAAPCPLHDSWKGIRGQIVNLLEQTTVADLVRAAVTAQRSVP